MVWLLVLLLLAPVAQANNTIMALLTRSKDGWESHLILPGITAPPAPSNLRIEPRIFEGHVGIYLRFAEVPPLGFSTYRLAQGAYLEWRDGEARVRVGARGFYDQISPGDHFPKIEGILLFPGEEEGIPLWDPHRGSLTLFINQPTPTYFTWDLGPIHGVVQALGYAPATLVWAPKSP